MDSFEIKIRLNVDREQAEELYDEIESYLNLCFETVLQNDRSMSSVLGQRSNDQILRVVTAPALTGFLIEKLGNSLIKVENVEFLNNICSDVKVFHISIIVPNLWAVSYGKDQIDERLNDAISFFQKDKTVPDAAFKTAYLETENFERSTYTIFNGLPCNPIIGSIYYDQLRHCMKRWDRSKWHDA